MTNQKNLKDLNGVYDLTIKTNAGGVYSEKPITGSICIENGQIRGADELNIIWCGFIECLENEHVKYKITVDPKKLPDIVAIRKDNGLMTSEDRDFIGTFKVSEKSDGELMLSSFENMSSDNLSSKYKAVVSLRRISVNTDCAICKE